MSFDKIEEYGLKLWIPYPLENGEITWFLSFSLIQVTRSSNFILCSVVAFPVVDATPQTAITH
jgi:hypothetical protein